MVMKTLPVVQGEYQLEDYDRTVAGVQLDRRRERI